MESRPFDPLDADSYLVGRICPLCGAPLLIGHRPSLVVDAVASYRPGSDAAKRLEAGRAHNAQAEVVHWDCVVRLDLPRVR